MRLGERGRGPSRTTFALVSTTLACRSRGSQSPANGLHCGCEQAHRALVKTVRLLLYHWKWHRAAITPPFRCSAWCKTVCGHWPAVTVSQGAYPSSSSAMWPLRIGVVPGGGCQMAMEAARVGQL